MRSTIIFALLLILAAPAWGQPEITSMEIHESHNKLIIRGSMSLPGSVTVDGVETDLIDWTDSIVIVSLPKLGPGSVGPVVVKNQFGLSEPRRITRFNLHYDSFTHHEMSCGASDASGAGWQLVFRVPLETMLLEGDFVDALIDGQSGSMDGSFIHTAPFDPICARGDMDRRVSDSDSNFAFQVRITSTSRRLYASVPEPDIPFTGIDLSHPWIVLSEHFEIVEGYNQNSFNGNYYGASWKGSVDFPVRPLIVQARQSLPVIAPEKDELVRNGIIDFEWSPASWATHFDLQISKSPMFNNLVAWYKPVNEILSVECPQSSGEYFWRVRGSTDTISGRWSETRSFRVKSASVIEADEASLPDAMHSVYDLLGRLVLQYHGKDAELAMHGLRTGSYIVTSPGRKAQLRFIP